MRLRYLVLLAGLAAGCATTSRSASSTAQPAPAPATQAPAPPPADPVAVEDELRRRMDTTMSVLTHIQVEVDRNGVASLTGFINSDAERDEAVKVARRTPGVTAVTEDLRVVPIYLDRNGF